MEWEEANSGVHEVLRVQGLLSQRKKDKGGKLGVVRYKGVLVGYAEDRTLVRVWNPWKDNKVLNVWGTDYDETMDFWCEFKISVNVYADGFRSIWVILVITMQL